jgi:hypothetical protein
MIAGIADLTDDSAPLEPMPRIDTSSDMYQNRDRSLTTFKKDLDPSVAYRDLPRADNKQRVREIQRDVPLLKNADIRSDEQRRDINKATLAKPAGPERSEPRYPPLYEPRKAPTDRPVDAGSFVTGGTVDVRA